MIVIYKMCIRDRKSAVLIVLAFVGIYIVRTVVSVAVQGVSTFGSGLEGEVTPEKLHDIVQTEIGLVFKEVLKDAGVYKCTEEGRTAFMRFVDRVNA